MAKVDKSALHDFVDQEIVTESHLDQNFEVLRVASNDNHERLLKRIETVDKDGLLKATLPLDTVTNFLKFKDSNNIRVSIDLATGTMTISSINLISKTDLESTEDGNSGADKVRATPITGLTGATVQTILEELKSQLSQATTGTIPDGSLGVNKLSFDVATQAELDAAILSVNTHLDSAPESMQMNLSQFNMYRSSKDSNGVFTVVEFKRSSGTLYLKSVLSGGTSPQYTTRTVTYHDNSNNVIRTDTWTIAYDVDGDVVSEVKS